MLTSTRSRLLALATVVVVGVVAFLLFRPDTLVLDDRVDESLDEAFAADVEEVPASSTTTTTQAVIAGGTTATTGGGPATTTTTAPAVPVAIGSGSFTGIDHRASGTATVYEQDGRFVLRFEDDTDIQNGPDLYVWVLPADGYEDGTPTEYLDLGRLKGNVGGQNYELPQGFDPDRHRTVLIWCLRFDTPFAVAVVGP